MQKRFKKNLLGPVLRLLIILFIMMMLIWQIGGLSFIHAQSSSPQHDTNSPIQNSGAESSFAKTGLSSKKILILHSFAYAQPAYRIIDKALIDSFVANGINFNNLYFEFLDLARKFDQEYRKGLVEFLRNKYNGQKFDLAMTLHPDALLFLLREGRDVYPQGPIISILDEQDVEHSDLKRPLISLRVWADATLTAKNIFSLKPDTQKILLVSGTSALDRRFANWTLGQLKKWKDALEVEEIPPLPLADILKKVSQLPPKTAILYTTVYSDSTGRTFMPPDVARMISRSANAPVFGMFETLLGDNGVVGGTMMNHRFEGERAVRSAMEVLAGNVPIKPITIFPGTLFPMFDWQQIQRWGMNASALPSDAIILNKPVSAWEKYKAYIIAAMLFFLAETGLIILLIAQRRRKKAAEESLRQKTEELDRFFNVTLDVLCIANTQGYFLRLNPAAQRILGYTREELMSMRFLDLIHPEDLEKTREAVSALASQKEISSFENRYRCKDGTYRWLQWSLVPAGNLIYAAARDVTEKKKSEEALYNSEVKYCTLYESMRDAFVKVDMRGQIQEFNFAYQKMLGYSDEELRRMTHKDFTPAKWHAFEAGIIETQVLKRGYSEVYEKEYVGKNGVRFPVELRTFLLRNLSGEIEGMWAIVRDISERKKAEEELKQHQEHLEELVRDRTAALIAARDQAEVANRAKSTFLANMSHELRTPLNSILGIAQLMERDPGFPVQHQETLKILSHSGAFLLELINDLLEISKIEAGKMTSVLTTFDLHSFLDDLEEMTRLRAAQKGLTLVFEYKSPLPQYIETDMRKLRQVLVNLLGNAIKYTEKGQVTLRIRYKEGVDTSSGGNILFPARLQFEIQDTGIGIAPEDTQKIFEPFVQLNPAQSTREGTGLGLTLSRMFIELLGGEISIQSQVGKGSTFVFDIAIKLAEGTTIRTPSADRRVIGLRPDQSYRLLVVDDSAENRLVLRRLLEQGGFSVLEAGSGQEAVDIFHSSRPHLIWMDLRMPGMDGEEAARRIREAESAKGNIGGKEIRTPVIALTAGMVEDEKLTSFPALFDGWVSKPFREGEIFDILKEHLKVELLYQPDAERKMPGGEEMKRNGPTPADLAVLPVEWLQDFFQTLRKARSPKLVELIGRIPSEHADLAETLGEWVRFHRLDKLIPLTQEALRERNHG